MKEILEWWKEETERALLDGQYICRSTSLASRMVAQQEMEVRSRILRWEVNPTLRYLDPATIVKNN